MTRFSWWPSWASVPSTKYADEWGWWILIRESCASVVLLSRHRQVRAGGAVGLVADVLLPLLVGEVAEKVGARPRDQILRAARAALSTPVVVIQRSSGLKAMAFTGPLCPIRAISFILLTLGFSFGLQNIPQLDKEANEYESQRPHNAQAYTLPSQQKETNRNKCNFRQQ